MFQKIKQLFKRGYLISQLMQFYSILLVGIILLGVVALSVYTNYANQKNLNNQIEVMENHLDTFINNKNTTMSFMYMELAGSHAAVENIRQYIELSPSDYFKYTEEFWSRTSIDNSVSTTLTSFFHAFSDLEEMYITLDDSDSYVKATRLNQNGTKMTGAFIQPNGLTIKRHIVNQYDFQPIGMIYAVFSKEAAIGSMAESVEALGISSFVYDQGGSVLFSESNHLKESDQRAILESIAGFRDLPEDVSKKYLIYEKNTNRDVSHIILASRKTFFRKNLTEMGLILLVGVVLTSVLLITLRRTFRRYLKQVTTLVQITHSVGEGNLKDRVDTGIVQEELYDLATAINFMIESLDQFIKENYELEIKQRDAHLRALQAQINPHFLYNTLEYIRMYALSLQQEELADVVFAFSALLRNNTTHEKTTTLEKELSFCEKYVYLFQMRYPDQIAYHFKIDDSLKQLKIPKFSIQPLIENYFVHGIDYTRFDNVISVNAAVENDDIVIKIRDNGKGVANQRLQDIRRHLDEPEEKLSNSIGLKNVHERMKSFFGDQYQMEIFSSEESETVLVLKIKQEEGFFV